MLTLDANSTEHFWSHFTIHFTALARVPRPSPNWSLPLARFGLVTSTRGHSATLKSPLLVPSAKTSTDFHLESLEKTQQRWPYVLCPHFRRSVCSSFGQAGLAFLPRFSGSHAVAEVKKKVSERGRCDWSLGAGSTNRTPPYLPASQLPARLRYFLCRLLFLDGLLLTWTQTHFRSQHIPSVTSSVCCLVRYPKLAASGGETGRLPSPWHCSLALCHILLNNSHEKLTCHSRYVKVPFLFK